MYQFTFIFNKKLFLFRVWFLYLPKLNGICQVVIPTGEDIRKSTAKNPAENAKGKKCFSDKMKIFFFQNLYRTRTLAELVLYLCLSDNNICVEFSPLSPGIPRWIVFHIMIWQSLAVYYCLIESESCFSGPFPVSLLVSTVTVCSYYYSYTGNYIPSRSWFSFSLESSLSSLNSFWKQFLSLNFSPIVMHSWGTEHSACSVLIGGKSYWPRFPNYTSFSNIYGVKRLMKLVNRESLNKTAAMKVNSKTQM